ncbi:MAG: hypothetical protein R2851_21565 [Caldilineaceae bacterium]
MRCTATLGGSHRVEITYDGETQALDADAIILAPGSVPVFPEGMRPDVGAQLALRLRLKPTSCPRVNCRRRRRQTGTEFVYLFNRLGVDVTWVVDPFGVLPPLTGTPRPRWPRWSAAGQDRLRAVRRAS